MAKSVQITVNGQPYTQTAPAASGKYEFELIAPADSSFPFDVANGGGYYPIEVMVTDEFGNSETISSTVGAFQDKLRLYTKETHKPDISIDSPTSGDYVTGTHYPTIRFSASDKTVEHTKGYSGLNTSSLSVKVNGRAVDLSGLSSQNQYDDNGVIVSTVCEVTTDFFVGDGSVTIEIDGRDNDGNAAETARCTFTLDNTAPELKDITPADEVTNTNQSTMIISGTATDSLSDDSLTVTIQLNGGEPVKVDVRADGYFEKEITFTQKINTIVITATDGAGVSTTVTRTVNYSSTKPIFKSVVIMVNDTPIQKGTNPAIAGQPYKIIVEVE